MKLNNISCTNYNAGERFSAFLRDCTQEQIGNINPSELIITADDGTMAEVYSCYGRLYSVKHILSDNSYEIEFERVPKTEALAGSISKSVDKVSVLASLVFVCLAQSNALDDETIAEYMELFPMWDEKLTCKSGMIVRFENALYRCTADISEETSSPDVDDTHWVKIGASKDEVPLWSQPLGAHDAYPHGAIVKHNNKLWKSTIDNNVWEPGVYGWNEEE